jgi:pimeloyl-ACP methyl ester carboxylesterase
MKTVFAFIVVSIIFISIIEADELRDFLKGETRYWGIQDKITPAQLDQLADLKRKTEAPELSQEQRTQAYTALFQYVQKLRGYPEGRVPAATATNFWAPGQSPVPPTTPVSNPGHLGNFKKRGTGRHAMILIPDLGADWTVFDSFMERNESMFTFYAITLPGFGGTNPPRRPASLDFGSMDWWVNAETAVLNLIRKENVQEPIVLGHQAGAYLAMKLALENPKVVRGAVVLNGLLYAPVPGIPPNTPQQERVKIVNSWTPAEVFPNPSPAQYRAVMLQNGEWFCKNKERQKRIADMLGTTRSSVWWNYFAELATTDLTMQMKRLRLPVLVLPSVYDAGSVGVESSKTAIAQWEPLEKSVSSLPITVIRIEDCRAYATEDQPEKLDQAIRQWIEKL